MLQILAMTRYLHYTYVIVALPNQFQSKARAHDLVMLEYHIDRVSLTVSGLWPFEIWHASVPRPSYRQTLYIPAPARLCVRWSEVVVVLRRSAIIQF